ncbi:MAG: PAS domain S-box protein [Deltaproteobacteria bacterium]|nr:PAS domain S-box protein [Deltaproteobacteria bacterium]
MEQYKTLNVAIVGGGPGCKAIMEMIFAEKLSQLRMKLVGVASNDPQTVGYLFAQEKGIYTTEDYHELYKLKDLHIIIELTGHPEVAEEIFRTKPEHVRLMDHVAARLFWDIFQLEEKRIEERTRAEDIVRQSEEKYKTLIESSLTGIFIHQDGKYVFVNDRFAETHGCQAEELLGKDPMALIHPDERETLKELAAKRLRGEAVPQQYIVRRLRKDGKTVWCEMMATVIEYKGKPAVMGNMIDISEHRRMENALRKSEDKYSTLVENSLTGIYIDQGGTIQFCNNKFAEIYGYSRDELMGMDPRKLVHPEDRPFTNDIRTKRLKGEEAPSEYEARGLKKSGESVWVARRNAAIEFEGQSAILGNIADITERKRAEERRRDSEARLRTILNSVHAGIIVIDPETHTIVDVNPVAAQMVGDPKEEIVGKACHRYVCPAEEGQCPITDLGQTVDNAERVLLTASGKSIPILKTVTSVTLGGRHHLLESFLDITELKRAQERLRESQERYRIVLEASPDPVVVYDMEGQCTYLNPAFTRVFGWTQEELLGKKVGYVPEQNWPETQMMIDKVLAGENFSGIESRRHTKDGKILDVSISAAIYVSRESVPIGSIHILRDITAQKQVEEALQKAHDELEQRVEERTAKLGRTTEQLKQELTERKRAEEALRLVHKDLAKKAADLEAVNEELSEYTYVVSHDLGAPLRAIHNYADFLREDLEDSLGGEQKTYLDNIDHAVHQGEELVEDLLELSRVGKGSGPTEGIDMGTFLKKLVTHLDLSRDVDVVIGNEWPTIEAEQTLLRQIFQNLIGNAIKFNSSAAKRVEMGWFPVDQQHCEIFVRDNGIGIEPRHHEQIFQVFQRLHTRAEYDGTGLGLAIVKKATGKLHGSVRVESKPGEGSTFFVTLPKT